MKFATPAVYLLQAATILAVPAALSQADAATSPISDPTTNDGLPSDVNPDPSAGPPSWRLDCGAPGITSMCSASNSGAHCDPITGALTIILEGTCGGCKCISADQCTSRCG